MNSYHKLLKNALLENPFINEYRNESSDNAVYLLFCDYAGAEKWIRDSAKPESYFNNYIKAFTNINRNL